MSEEASRKFDIIIFDCPPRLSTATVNALCSSTHLIIPTVPDGLSLEAVPNFTEMAASLRAGLNPGLRLAGIVPTLTQEAVLKPAEKSRLQELAKDAHHFGEPYIFSRNIPHKAAIANIAGDSIAFHLSGAKFREIRQLFTELGAEVAKQIGI